MLKEYNSIIKTLQTNDRNSAYDEILPEVKNLPEAIRILKSCLERMINEDLLEGEELQFYMNQLERVNQLK